MSEVIFKTVDASRTTITELMIPSYANFGGKIHGGIVLSLMDKVAYACSAKHSGNYCVTVTVDNVEFHEPIEVGNLLSLHASVNYVGNTSLVVGIKVMAQNINTGETKHTNSSYFTMVAKGKDDKPAVVPGLVLESEDDVRRFLEAMKRKELKTLYKDEFKLKKEELEDLKEEIAMLEDEKCQIVMPKEK